MKKKEKEKEIKEKEEKGEEEEKYKSRNFNLNLYPDDKTHVQALDYIQKNCDYALIYHDKDTNEFGEIKKTHVHVVVRFDNPKWNTSLAKDLGITPNYIQECRSLKRSLLYLIHYYDENKYQYSVDEVKGPLKKRLFEILCNGEKNENEKMMELIQYIDDFDEYLYPSQFIRYAVGIGFTDVVRRDWCLLSPILVDHNENYRPKRKED